MKRLIILAFAITCVVPIASAQDTSLLKRAALAATVDLESEIHRMSMTLWTYSETALLETKSATILADILEAEGFAVERGVAGMPTAFVASWGSGSPLIGILAEYDALPGVGNEAKPHRAVRKDGVTTGHGCGHNLFGAASVGAAMALKRAIEAQGASGTVRLYGTPAEETLVGKVYMAKEGIFDDADAVLEWHPGQKTAVRNQPGRALNNFEVEFFGQAAHASADPWNGRSSLDAVELMNHGVNLMREHVRPSTRIHYVTPRAGEVPNVVPEYAKVWYFVRDVDRESVSVWYDWILKIAEGAALATRTNHKVFLVTGVHEYNLNRPLQEALQANLESVGAPSFTDEEQAFAKELQKNLGLKETGYDTEVQPLSEGTDPLEGGSTDAAEVSHIAPTVGFSIVTAADEVPWHSWATTACHGTDASVKGALVAAKVLALTGADLFADSELRRAAREYFDKKTEGASYASPLPAEQSVPLPKGHR